MINWLMNIRYYHNSFRYIISVLPNLASPLSQQSKFYWETQKCHMKSPRPFIYRSLIYSIPAAFLAPSRQSTSSLTPFTAKDDTPKAFLPANPTPHIFDASKRAFNNSKTAWTRKILFTIFTKGSISTSKRLSRLMRRARCLWGLQSS